MSIAGHSGTDFGDMDELEKSAITEEMIEARGVGTIRI